VNQVYSMYDNLLVLANVADREEHLLRFAEWFYTAIETFKKTGETIAQQEISDALSALQDIRDGIVAY
jgi:hypothetical protein